MYLKTMLKQRTPDNEEARLAKLYSYNIINNYKQTGTFKHVASMAATIFNVPIAFVDFVDRDKLKIDAAVGLDGMYEADREISLCSLAIQHKEVTVFENAKLEPCLLSNPMVHGSFGIEFYAGAPLTTPDGYNVGVVAIVDKKPRTFSKEEQQILKGLAAVVMEELEERRARS